MWVPPAVRASDGGGTPRWSWGDPKGRTPERVAPVNRLECRPPFGSLLGTREVAWRPSPSARLEANTWGTPLRGGLGDPPRDSPGKGGIGPRSLVQSHRSEVECGSVYWGGPGDDLEDTEHGASVRFGSVCRLCAAKVALPVMTQNGPFVPCARPLRLGHWRELREESRRATFNFC